MRRISQSLFLVLLLLAAAPAFAAEPAPDGAYQGYSGGDVRAPQAAPVAAPETPEVAPQASVASVPAPAQPQVPAVSAVAPQVAATPPPPPDPCAAYAAAPASYAVCKDRMDKIARMKAAGSQRDSELKAYYDRLEKATAPPQTAPTANQVPPANQVAPAIITTPAPPVPSP